MSLKEKAWDILQARLDREPEGNRAMNENIKEYMEWALKKAGEKYVQDKSRQD